MCRKRRSGGGDGIRTHDRTLGPYNGLANQSLSTSNRPKAAVSLDFCPRAGRAGGNGKRPAGGQYGVQRRRPFSPLPEREGRV